MLLQYWVRKNFLSDQPQILHFRIYRQVQMRQTSMQCRYKPKKCSQPRVLKKNGKFHSLCHEHRLKANSNQRKLDQKKRKVNDYHPYRQKKKEKLQVLSYPSIDDLTVNYLPTGNTFSSFTNLFDSESAYFPALENSKHSWQTLLKDAWKQPELSFPPRPTARISFSPTAFPIANYNESSSIA